MFDIPVLWLASAAILAGFVGLIWSADRFIGGSAAIAKNFGVSPLMIGLTIVSLGTSTPEMVVSINASLAGMGDLAIGNALGSNLANIGLVLAITALISPLPIQKHLLTREIPVMMVVTAIAGWFLFDASLSVVEGTILLALVLPLLGLMILNQRNNPSPEEEDNDIPDMTTLLAFFWFAFGLAVLIVSSKLLVWGAQEVALSFGISPLIVGLTVVAVGTSLPELAATVTSALKGHHDIALGNIIGSNIFNILTVMSLPGIFGLAPMEDVVFWRDYLSMAGVTLLMALAIGVDYWLRNQAPAQGENPGSVARLGRRIGCLLLAAYAAYYYVLFAPTA